MNALPQSRLRSIFPKARKSCHQQVDEEYNALAQLLERVPSLVEKGEYEEARTALEEGINNKIYPFLALRCALALVRLSRRIPIKNDWDSSSN